MPMGRAYLRLSLHGNDRLVGSLPVEFVAEPMITMIQPTNVLLSSGNRPVVTVYGNYFIDTEMMLCRFGQRQTVRGQVTQGSKILCVVPDKLQVGNLSLSVHFRNGFPSNEHHVFIVPDIGILRITPSWAFADRGVMVTILSRYVSRNTILTCNFGNRSVPVQVVSESQSFCLAPPAKPEISTLSLYSAGVLIKNSDFEYIQRPDVVEVIPRRVPMNSRSPITIIGSDVCIHIVKMVSLEKVIPSRIQSNELYRLKIKTASADVFLRVPYRQGFLDS
eukprot:763510-Hanusia_phi.AAC.1